MKALLSPVLVGLLVAASLGALVFFISIAGRKGLSKGESYVVHVIFDDASGLAGRSRVVVAGIDIGKIESISLVGRRARVDVRISNRFVLFEDASVMKRSESLLGDSLLDVDPGTEGKRPLGNGDEIRIVRAAPGMDQMMEPAKRTLEQTERIAAAVAEALASDDGQLALANVIRTVNETSLHVSRTVADSSAQVARILAHMEALTGEIRRLASAQESQVTAIVANARAITDDARGAVKSLGAMVEKHDGGVDEALATVQRSLQRLDETLASAQAVAKGVEKGEGAVGMLLRDPELASRVSNTAKEATAFVDRLTGLKVELGMRSEGHYQPRGGDPAAFSAKHTFGARIIPANSSRYYGVDAVSEPRGHVSRVVETELRDGEVIPKVTETWSDRMRINAYLAQRWGPATFRVGLLESTGGVGVDLDLLRDRLMLRADAFDFLPVTGGAPRLRAMLRFTLADHFDLYAGADDLLNGPGAARDPAGLLTGPGRSVFLGGGFRFSDEDIKAILVTTGVPSF